MKLELECYGGLLDQEEKGDSSEKRSSKARHDLTRTACSRAEEVRSHIMSQNDVHAGLITWMKGGVISHNVNPRPINFKEALSYLMERDTYESTGLKVLDIYGLEVDVQFDKIMKILSNSSQDEEPKKR